MWEPPSLAPPTSYYRATTDYSPFHGAWGVLLQEHYNTDMKKIKQLLSFAGAFIILICLPVRAEITPTLMQEWARQPNNVQWNVFYQNTNIQVVDQLDWQSANLYDTYAYTRMNVQNMQVQSIDMRIKRGMESALTHEVGHCISNAGHSPYWWAYRPEFIQIWQAERFNNALMTQGIDDIREYFACAYDLYLRFPQILKQANPMTYNYITVVLNFT